MRTVFQACTTRTTGRLLKDPILRGDGVSKCKTIQSTRIATVREIWRLMDKQIVPARDGTDWKGGVVVPGGE